ncbi:MAG: ATP-binding cassette domain-containing protein [Chitinophagaceae bacterium]|nr:ATP-binding cassette domain-containing protein [Chitinophagaceae bacterium]
MTFAYENDVKNKVLQNVTFKIRKGEKICLMGPQGAGKSTLLKLLTGAYPDHEGNILLNNISLGNYDLQSLRNNTGILLSQQDIFNGTLLENITMGNRSITVEQILILANQLNLNTYLADLKDGFNTQLYPAGEKLSRKIIHKILLLRALINTPQLLLLEDPFDMEQSTRESIMNYLLTLDSTVIATFNNIDLAKKFDTIIYFQDGIIKAYGKWDDIKDSL